jgi:Flp pilus assembly protein TadD
MPRIRCAVIAFCFATSAIACSTKQAQPLAAGRPNEHNQLFTDGSDLISRYMPLDGVSPKDPRSSGARRDITTGIEKLEKAIALNPKNWSAHWFIGKGHQIQGDSRKAYDSFKTSWEIQQKNANVARDYMLSCLALGHSAEGVTVAEQAMKLKPDDPSVMSNYALALLIDGQTDRAAEEVQKSLDIDPADRVTLELEKMIGEVKSGKRPRPTKLDDLAGVRT